MKLESSKSLEALREVAEELAAQYLASYTSALGSGAAARLKHKEVNDALWGTVSLSPVEVAVLDSPLLQRLRFIRLMGCAHWVYPGAVHTRFEHAIGTLFQVQQLIDSLNARAAANALNDQVGRAGRVELIDKEDAQLLRLSSLLSHVGHLAFSESAVAELESRSEFATATRDFAADPKRTDPGSDPTFCQLLAHYIVRSAAVREFLLTLVRANVLHIAKKNDESAVDHIVRIASLAVIGRMFEENRPQLQGLVSGPFDAATLDELVRDAKFSGIPAVLDIRRLVQKLAVQSFVAAKLPRWIGGSLVEVEQHETVDIFGIPVTATSVLNELQLAQVLITTKIRRHPKVLAAEQMLRSVLRTVGALAASKDLLKLLYSTAEDGVIGLTTATLRAGLAREPGRPLTEEEAESLESAAGTLSAIRERRLWVRAVQLSDIEVEGDEAGMVLLQDQLRHVQRAPQFLAELRQEVAAVQAASGQSVASEASLAAQISLHTLKSISADARVGRAVVLPPGRDPYMLSREWDVADNWVNLYLRGQPTAYVFSTPELADAVYVAFERLADRKFKASLPSGTLEASKRSKKRVQALKRQTAGNGFWSGHSWGIRPTAAIWGQLHNRVQDVAFRLNRIETVSVTGEARDFREATYRWLEQFETDNDIECALTMLEHFEIVDRKKTTDAFNALFTAHPEFKGAYAVSFGDPKDGGVIQGYFAADNPQVVKVVTLDQWVREPEDLPLIFVDDCCGSGGQVCDVLAAWLETGERGDLDEERGPQPKEVQERLARTQIAFLFITAWNAGVRKIEERLADLRLNAIVFPFLSDNSIPFVEEKLKAHSHLDVDAFVARCKAIGTEILDSNNVPAKKVEERNFGYGNRGMLLATLVNVPTQTTTLIWESGTVDGVRWNALLPRRKKE